MTVSVANAEAGIPVACSELFQIPQEYNFYDSDVTASITGKLFQVESHYVFQGRLVTCYQCCCDKCLKPMEYPLDVEIIEKFSDTGYQPKDEDIWTFTAKEIDLRPAVESALILNIPAKAVCKNDCKGLCSVCGHDLNLGKCDCDTTHIDPRFEGLRSLFQDKEV